MRQILEEGMDVGVKGKKPKNTDHQKSGADCCSIEFDERAILNHNKIWIIISQYQSGKFGYKIISKMQILVSRGARHKYLSSVAWCISPCACPAHHSPAPQKTLGSK